MITLSCVLYLLVYFEILNFSNQVFADNLKGSCGRLTAGRGNIVGGSYAIRGSFPWVATLNNSGVISCGGTLLTKNKVLTAAHCIHGKDDQYKFSAKDILVILGAHNLSIPLESGRVTVNVEEILVHPDWNVEIESFDADIAILTLASDVNFTRYIQPICLIDPGSKPESIKSGFSVGHGKSEDETKMHEEVLKFVKTQISETNEHCFYTNHDLLGLSSLRTFCGGSRGEAGVCVGDSGNGLFINFEGISYLRGIVSSSLLSHYNCDVHNYAIFTNVVKFHNWITENIDFEDDAFVTIWVPEIIYEKKEYNVVFLPNKLKKRTEIGFFLRKNYGTTALASGKMDKFTISNTKTRGSKNSFDSIITLFRNETNLVPSRQLCITQNLTIDSNKKEFHIFIQTDKPTYYPGDEVKFRILLFDKNLMIFNINNIHISIMDPSDRVLEVFEDLDRYAKVVEEKFPLSLAISKTGTWKIHVIVDKKPQWIKSKTFEVLKSEERSTTHLAYIDVRQHHLLPTSFLQLSFYAKNQAESFLSGNAKLTIKCTTSNQIIVLNAFNNITGIHNVNYKVRDDLKVLNISTNLDFEIDLEFMEEETKIVVFQKAKFTVHANDNSKINAKHHDRFIPGLSFDVKVLLFDWKDQLIQASEEKVKVYLDCAFKDGEEKTIMSSRVVTQGFAIFNSIIPENVEKLSIRIKCVNTVYEKMIKLGGKAENDKKLEVDYFPKFLNYRDTVTIHVSSTSKLNQLIAVVMTRHGNKESHQKYCYFQTTCTFNLTIWNAMMPKSKIVVYRVEDSQNIYQGETTIFTEEMTRNELNYDLKISTEQKGVEISFSTEPRSTVFFLAVDKNLVDSTNQNTLKNEALSLLTDFDGINLMAVLQMKKSNWHECLVEEIKRIERGRRSVVLHRGNEFEENKVDEEFDHIQDNKYDSKPNIEAPMIEDIKKISLLDRFEVPSGNIKKLLSVPNKKTSWMISAFSVSRKYGVAFGPTKEVIFKDQFYIKVALPYSIRFNETLRVNVVAYNFIDFDEDLDVKVRIFDQDNSNYIRFYEDTCDTTGNTENESTKTVKVTHRNAKILSFCIVASPSQTIFKDHINIKINASATSGNNSRYFDEFSGSIKVESAGVKMFEIEYENQQLKPSLSIVNGSVNLNKANQNEEIRFRLKIEANYLLGSIADNYQNSTYATDDLAQMTSNFKICIERIRYLRNSFYSSEYLECSKYFQSIMSSKNKKWSYENTTGYIAHFVDAVLSAMEIGVLPKDTAFIEEWLNAVKSAQTENGQFNSFGNFPQLQSNLESIQYFQTAYTLIPFLKFKKFTTKNYKEVIAKGFELFNRTKNLELLDKEALSIAAYAYALDFKFNQANLILNQLKMYFSTIDGKMVCFSVSKKKVSCDLRFTSYVALTYLTMENIGEAKYLATWILNQPTINSYDESITTEVIAKYLIAVKKRYVFRDPELKITLTNGMDFKKEFKITADSEDKFTKIDFPQNTINASWSINGTGICLITKITEKTVTNDRVNSKFNLSVVTFTKQRENEGIIKICATYKPNDISSTQSLFSVIFDVTLPTGYVYEKILNMEIMLVELKLEKTRVHIYFNDFEQNRNYCVIVRVTKVFTLSNVQPAGVMVYETSEKENPAIKFYNFDSD